MERYAGPSPVSNLLVNTMPNTPVHRYSFCVARWGGGGGGGRREERPFITSKIVRRMVAGTIGLGCPVEMSPRNMVSGWPNWMSWSTSPDMAMRYAAFSMSFL